ncbi:hypothetical protein LCGC14_0947940 [marine sediment metagenome]|uniref:Anti-CBASS protein Acb1-like N-terminal domain-containing protein n=1 Tax=marine sediment metagenome TaxID=412755 RepID=A0A0F9NI96_9ZZZZ
MTNKGVTITNTGRGVKASLVSSSERSVRIRKQGNGIDTDKELSLRVLSGLISRMQLANLAGKSFGGKRDLWKVFGYERQLTAELFLAKYVRQDIASRVIDAPPNAIWANPPAIVENDAIKTKWEELVEKHNLWGTMNRADRLARLNHFSILLFGFDDGTNLQTPLGQGRDVKELLYVRAIGSRQVTELKFNAEPGSPKFGQPEMYKIEFDDPNTRTVSSGTTKVTGLRNLTVHASRVVHIVENPLEDTVIGIPIMEKVYNLLDDLLKVAGGTPETYWLTANRGIQADVEPDRQLDPADAAALSDEIEEYQHQLRRFIRTRGVKLDVLDSTTPAPKEVFEMLMALLSGTTGIPRRILLGSEAGQLASEQDRANWAERISERRVLFAQPLVLKPTTELLQSAKLLPEGVVKWEWPSAFILSPLEKGQTSAQHARAVGNLSRQTGNKEPMQITSREEAREMVGLEGDLPESEVIETEDDESVVPRSEGSEGETED